MNLKGNFTKKFKNHWIKYFWRFTKSPINSSVIFINKLNKVYRHFLAVYYTKNPKNVEKININGENLL